MDNFYNFIADKEELKYFYDKVLMAEPEEFSSYLVTLSLRSKKLSEQEKTFIKNKGYNKCGLIYSKPFKIDTESSFDKFKCLLQEYEVKYGTFGIDEKIAQKPLTLYISFNPSNTISIASRFVELYESELRQIIKLDDKDIVKIAKRNIASLPFKISHLFTKNECIITKYIHLDFDIRDDLLNNKEAKDEAVDQIIICGKELFGNSNFFVIDTQNGIHVLIKIKALENASKYLSSLNKDTLENEYGIRDNKFNPIKAYIFAVEENYSYTFKDEPFIKEQVFVPIPGTYQYGEHIVRILNKE